MKFQVHLILTLCFFCISFVSFTQETNYWFNNYGSSSFLKGGIVVAGVESNIANYYNPGALAFFEGQSIEAQADLISLDAFNIKNGAGEGVPISMLLLDVSPSLFAFSRQLKKKPKWVYGISILTKSLSSISYIVRNEYTADLISAGGEEDTYHGLLTYDNRARENWLIGAIAYKISPKIGIGMATNVVIKSQDFSRSYEAEVLPEGTQPSLIGFTDLALVNQSQNFNYRSLGVVFKPGININLNPLKVGLVITTPNLNLGVLNNQTSRKNYALLPDVQSGVIYEADAHSDYAGVYKTPWIVDIGIEYQFNNTKLSVVAAWFSRVDTYNMVEKKEGSSDFNTVFTFNPQFAIPQMANKSVLNIGIAIEQKITEHLSYLGSFRTDFNYFDDSQLERFDDFVPYMAFWDMYHITSGFMLSGKSLRLSMGINYGLGWSKGDPQVVNMTNVSQENFLKGDINTNTTSQYHNIGLMVGLSYTVGFLSKLEEKQ